MTTQDKISELQEKYGRKDLTLGCEIKDVKIFKKDPHFIQEEPFGIVVKDLREKFLYLCVDAGDQQEFDIRYDEQCDFKILGSPLTLSDVLKIAGAIFDEKKTDGVELNMGGRLFVQTEFGNLDWNLNHNLLRDQSKETISTIYKLLFL